MLKRDGSGGSAGTVTRRIIMVTCVLKKTRREI